MNKKILIDGMSCANCVNHVTNALEELSGVTKVTVDLDTKTALIETSGVVKDNDIKSAIDDAGYEVVGIEVQ